MLRVWKVMIWVGLVVVTLAAVLVAVVLKAMAPTTGPRVGAYPAPHTAFVVIDIQEDYTGPAARKPYRDGDRIVGVSNTVLAEAEARNLVVAYVENVIENPLVRVLSGGMNAPGALGTATDRRILAVEGGRHFTKSRSDAFSNPALDAYLRESQVDHVVLVGLDGAYCVNATARGALNRGLKVTLLTDGIATESRKSIDDLARGWREAGAETTTSVAWLQSPGPRP